MKNKKQIRPAGDPENRTPDYICPYASWGDMTGPIPTGTDNDPDPDSYRDIYPFTNIKK